MGKAKAPEPPDPKETSAAATSTNVGTAIANSYLGNVNQVTPDGTLNYDQSGSYDWNDPYTGKTYQVPTFTATQTLSDAQQAIKTQSDGAELNLATLANDQSGFLNDYMANPVDLSSENVKNYTNTHFMDDFDSEWSKQNDDYRTQLSNQGIKLGSDAYTRAMGEFSQNRSDARDNLYGNMYSNAQNSITAERNQPINEITALLSGSQVNQPNYVGTNQPSIATTDTAGLINNNYQQQVNAVNQQNAQTSGLLGGLFGVGAAFAGNPSFKFSDKRLKTDIEPIGKLKGHSVYEYRYKGEDSDGPKHTGVMAQEVERTRPDAVAKTKDGVRMVNYGALFGTGGGK